METPQKVGFLYLTRLNSEGVVLKNARRRSVAIYRDMHHLMYYADSELSELLGWIDLRYCRIEYSPDISESIVLSDTEANKVFKLVNQEGNKSMAAWYTELQQVQATIVEPREYGIVPSDIKGAYVFSMTFRSIRRDEIADEAEFGMLCHAMFLSKQTHSKVQTRWTVWRTYDAFKQLHVKLTGALGWQMENIEFRRDRKRDALMGSKSKSVLEARMQFLNHYMQRVLSISNITEFHKHHCSLDLKEFFNFELCFGEDAKRKKVLRPTNGDDVEKKSRSKSSKSRGSSKKSIMLNSQPVVSANDQLKNNEMLGTHEETDIPSTSSSTLELVTGEEAEALRSAVFQAVLTETRGNMERVNEFQHTTDCLLDGSIMADEYFEYIQQEFDREFTLWLVKDIVHLVPSDAERKILYERCNAFSSKPRRKSGNITAAVIQKKKSLSDENIPAVATQEEEGTVQKKKSPSNESIPAATYEDEALRKSSRPSSSDRISAVDSTQKARKASTKSNEINTVEESESPTTTKKATIHVEYESDRVKAKELHQEVLDKMYDLSHQDMDKVHDFQDQTKSFGKGELTAEEYVAYLFGAIGHTEAHALILQMARLLSNSRKREELISAMQAAYDRARRRKKQRSKQYSSDFLLPQEETAKMPAPVSIPTEAAKKKDRPKSMTHASSSTKRSSRNYSQSSKDIPARSRPSSKKAIDIQQLSIDDEPPVEEDSEVHTEIEENPVLARLRKQGAVNFLGGPLRPPQ